MKYRIMLIVVLLIVIPVLKVNAATNNIKEESANVTVGEVDVPVLNVEVTWGAMEFTINEETNYLWKDNTKTYELEPLNYSWISNDNYIDVKNKSYRNIEVNLKYNSLYDKIEGTFNKQREIIAKNNNMRFELILSGQINNTENGVIEAGSINLSIS